MIKGSNSRDARIFQYGREKKRNKWNSNKKEEVNVSLFTDDMILYIVKILLGS